MEALKPCCVKVSQLAIRETDGPGTHKELLALTGQILAIIDDQVATKPLALDEKLAEYVFFPLYHIFRQMGRYPMTLVENCVKCLNLLVVHGWRSKISPQLVRQIFSLLTFIIDGGPGSNDTPQEATPEELVLEAFRTQTALLSVAGASPTAASGLSASDAIPDLGRGITVILDGIVDGATPEIQREAVRALTAVYGAIREHAALANFMPGAVSTITKVLSSPARHKRLVLSECLKTVRIVLTRVLGDLRTRQILAKKDETNEEGEAKGEEEKDVLSPAWLKATAGQVKKALSIMMKLRTHESGEVRDALERLCISLLDECHSTLLNCTTMLIETAMILDKGVDEGSLTETSLIHLVGVYPELGESAKASVYGWMSSLPRMMQSSDEDSKQAAIHGFSKGIRILKTMAIESPVLDDSLPSTLRDSIVTLMSASREAQPNVTSIPMLLIDGDGSSRTSSNHDAFQPILLAHEGQRRLRAEIVSLLQTVGASSRPTKIASSLLETVQESSGMNQVTAFWLCFELLKASFSQSAETDALFNVSAFDDPSEDVDSVFNELYSFSLLLLDSHTESHHVDWRSEAIALEVVAFAAQRAKQGFRPELIDVLFPVATFLGSDVAGLQQHAVTALNIIAASCQYGGVADLIVDNVDYMVNSVSLRLNTLDISPSSTQVLLMMVRLSGPRLVPFLGDVVESIFSALENYHGYPTFVESLFAVLKEVVDQASRADGKLLTDRERSTTVDHRRRPARVEGLEDLAEFLRERNKRKAEMLKDAEETIRAHPTTPWKTDDDNDNKNNDDDDENNQEAEPPRDEEKPPNSPTYLLLQKVANLTQHYLTSPAPTLRRSLLELLATASPVLSGDEDSFLPLVNAIWPVVIGRLRDPEAFVAIEACHALSGLCRAAGDFLCTRFKTEWWAWMGDWCRKVKQSSKGAQQHRSKMNGPSSSFKDDLVISYRPGMERWGDASSSPVLERGGASSGGSLGRHAEGAKVSDAVSQLLVAIVTYVRVEEEMFDEILDLMAEVMEKDAAVRKALEVVNADAVWLARYERGLVDWTPLVV